jgi:hypothetical protein
MITLKSYLYSLGDVARFSPADTDLLTVARKRRDVSGLKMQVLHYQQDKL